MYEVDELKVYRGADIQITPKITVTQPTLGQIEEFGERRYFNAVQTLTAVPADFKWQLWDYANQDYTELEDYDFFVGFVSQIISSNKNLYEQLMSEIEESDDDSIPLDKGQLEELKINPLQLILKDIDLADFTPCTLEGTDQVILYDSAHDITIDRAVYTQIVDVVRKIHGFKRNNEIPANEITKMDLIEDARDDALASADKPYKSILKPLISALSVNCGMCGDERIWSMHVSTLFENIKRATKIQDSQLLLQGAYSGFADLKGVDKNRLDWLGDI